MKRRIGFTFVLIVAFIIISGIIDYFNFPSKFDINASNWVSFVAAFIAVFGTFYVTKNATEKQIDSNYEIADVETIMKLVDNGFISNVFMYVFHKDIFQYNFREEYYNLNSDYFINKDSEKSEKTIFYKTKTLSTSCETVTLEVNAILFEKGSFLMKRIYQPKVELEIIASFMKSNKHKKLFNEMNNSLDKILKPNKKNQKFYKFSIMDDICGVINYGVNQKNKIKYESEYTSMNNNNVLQDDFQHEFVPITLKNEDYKKFIKYFEELPFSKMVKNVYYKTF